MLYMLLDLASQIAPILDIIIVLLVLVLIYLLITRVFFVTLGLPKEQEIETFEMMQGEKLRQTQDLKLENQLLEETVKQAKQKYMKRKIDASTYKKIVEDSQEKITQNQAKLRILKQ